jgi:dihydroflavonol-4-reductase
VKRTLVTGGNGFIGQYLVTALLRRGHRVRILDVRPPGRALSEAQFLEGSILDPAKVREAVKDVDEVYHLAALPGMWMRHKDDFHAVNCLGTEVVIAAVRESQVKRLLHCSTESIFFRRSMSECFVTEQVCTTIDEMPGAYTRSKLAAEKLALEAAASGLPVVIANPTMPIGVSRSLTPPTLMLQYFVGRRVQFYLDFVLNLVDVRDVAAGLVLAMQRGRIGQRYVLGGENFTLKKLLALMAVISGRKAMRIPVSGGIAQIAAAMVECVADHLTHQAPSATLEGVRIALWSKPVSIEKSRLELGYAPGPIRQALEEVVSSILVDRLKRQSAECVPLEVHRRHGDGADKQ